VIAPGRLWFNLRPAKHIADLGEHAGCGEIAPKEPRTIFGWLRLP